MWAQALDPGFVTIDALDNARNITRYFPESGAVGPQQPAFTVTFTSSQCTFANPNATFPSGTNIVATLQVGANTLAVQYTAQQYDTPNSVAIALAADIMSYQLPGVTATPSGASVNLTGATFVSVAAFGALVIGFSAVNTPSTATFTAIQFATPAGTNIHAIFSVAGQKYDAQYTTLSTDTQNSVAAAVSAAINALGVVGVSASPSTNVVTLTGASFVAVNVGGSQQMHKEVKRIGRTVQITIWTNSPFSRYWIHDAVTSTIGAVDALWITLPDGGRTLVKTQGEHFDDQSQSSYNVYYVHLMFYVEYGVIQRQTGYQIGAISVDEVLQAEAQNSPQHNYQFIVP